MSVIGIYVENANVRGSRSLQNLAAISQTSSQKHVITANNMATMHSVAKMTDTGASGYFDLCQWDPYLR